MEGCGNKRFEQLAVIEFLTAKKKNPIDIQRRKQAMYGVKCVDVSTVRCWVWQFKQEGCCTTVASREIHVDIFTDGIQNLEFFSYTQSANRLWASPTTQNMVKFLRGEKHEELKLI
jgi:hypothetical protein